MHFARNSLSLRLSESLRRGQGVILAETAAWVVFLLVLVTLVEFATLQAKRVEANVTTSTLGAIAKASKQYIAAFGPGIADPSAGLLSPGGPPVVIPIAKVSAGAPIPQGPSVPGSAPLPSVQGGGFLPPTFIDKDAFGQSHDLVIFEPAAGKYEAIVLSIGGTVINNRFLGMIVQDYRGQAGEIENSVQGGSSAASTQIRGVHGGFDIPVSSLNAAGQTIAAPGHYAVLLSDTLTPTQLTMSQYLSRYSGGPGQTMHAGISMNGHNLDNANSLTFAAGGAIASSGPGTILFTPSGQPLALDGNEAIAGNQTISKALTLQGNATSSTLNSGNGNFNGAVQTADLIDHGNLTLSERVNDNETPWSGI